MHGETLVDLGLGLVTGIWRKRQVYRLPVDVAEKVEALEGEIEDLHAPYRFSEPRGSYSWQLVLKVPAECQRPGDWFEIGEVSEAEIEALEDDPGRMFSWPARCTRDPRGGSTDRILDSRAQDSIHGGSEAKEGRSGVPIADLDEEEMAREFAGA